MNAQQIFDEERLNHLRELKYAVSQLKAENAVLRDENAELRSHLDFAILAARDLESLADDARLVIVDGWNLILGARRSDLDRAQLFAQAKDRQDLEEQAARYLAERPGDLVWIVLDGPRFATKSEGRMRVSYTGGAGSHRADRFICDFLRMAAFRGDLKKIEVRTNDKDFRKDVVRILASGNERRR